MKVFTWIILTCYIVLFILLGTLLVAFGMHWISVEGAALWLDRVYSQDNYRVACVLAGIGIILLNGMYAELALAKVQRQKTIAFENPDGRVTVSLTAIEDFVRRSTQELPDVKEIRSDVVARKGKILVRAQATLWSGAHIPEAAEQIQGVVKSKVQEMLTGIEEPVLVQVHVSKIVHRDEKAQAAERRGSQFSPPYRAF